MGQDWLKTFYGMEMARLMSFLVKFEMARLPYLDKVANSVVTGGWVGGGGRINSEKNQIYVIAQLNTGSSFAR